MVKILVLSWVSKSGITEKEDANVVREVVTTIVTGLAKHIS